MSKISLDYRLSEIARNVTFGIIADIGCDHGKLSNYLLTNNIARFAYISDISAPSLSKAITLLSKNYNGRFEAIVSDGFKNYPKDVAIDTAIISGMGGCEIIKIISENGININKFVLQPQHNESDLKVYLSTHGFDIQKDYIIRQKDKFYNILVVVKGNRIYDEYEMYFGKTNFINKSQEFVEYLDFEYNKIINIIDSVDEDKRNLLNIYLDAIKLAKTRLGVEL